MQNRKPMILVFAGPNGSGKSTITQYFDIVGDYTNADEHKSEDIRVYPNEFWNVDDICKLIGFD